MKKIIIIWAGPGWLTSWMILASKWYEVEIFEKEKQVWWRNTQVNVWDYKFDLWPTFLIYLKVLEDIFENSWRKIEDYLKITRLDPLYRLNFPDWNDFYPRAKIEDTLKEIEKKFPWESENYKKYIEKEWKKLDVMLPCLEVPYTKITDFFSKRFLKALPRLDVFKSLYSRLEKYFKSENLRTAMTFQSKYLW